MFKPGQLYRHTNFMDVDMMVMSVEYHPEHDWYHLTVRYWNRYYMLFQGGIDNVTISKKEATNWTSINAGS